MPGKLEHPEYGPRFVDQASGGSFAFDEETLRGLIRDWLDLAISYDNSRAAAKDMAEVVGPGLDFASVSYAKAANASGASYLRYLDHNYEFCLVQAQKFQDALNDYLGVEHTNVVDIIKAGSTDERSGF